MSHPYDASTKHLVQARLADWLPLCGRATKAPVEVIDADLATITAAADRVLRVDEDPPWLLHLELQASRDPDFIPNLPAYNILLRRRHRMKVRTVAALLRPAADSPELTGVYQDEFPDEEPYLTFRYRVVRIWQLPAETFLGGGLGILPLAPLSAVTERDLPLVISRMQRRISREASADEAGTLWTATDVLMGLRWPRNLVEQLLSGVHGMKESVTYQAIVEEGRKEGRKEGKVEAKREDILRLGARRWGQPDAPIQKALKAIKDLKRLNRLMDRILDASSWEDLLTTR